MRRIGSLSDPQLAQQFADYLLTKQIHCNVQTDRDESTSEARESDLWIRDEEFVEQAKQELNEFLANPSDAKYQASEQASELRKAQQREDQRRKSLHTQYRGRPVGGAGGVLNGLPLRQKGNPCVIAIIAICVIASLATGFGRRPKDSNAAVTGQLSTQQKIYYEMLMVNPIDYYVTNDAFYSIKQGQVWRLLTPALLHGGPLHLAFNMMMIFVLGTLIERLHGSIFLLAVFVVTAVVGQFVQAILPPEEVLPAVLSGLAGTPIAVGASGAALGLFGYLWIRPQLSASYPIHLHPNNVLFILGYVVFCVFFMNGIANGAHIGGLLAGMLIAVFASKFDKW